MGQARSGQCGGLEGWVCYVGGWVVEGESGSEATYWQDGIRRELEDNYGGQVKSFCFEGSDVYMAGTNGYQDVKSAVYWKNGG